MKKVILAILDGWGESSEDAGNAIKSSKTPNMDMLTSYFPCTTLQASGVSVGLPWGTMGNSEVGHLTIGAGKVLYQNLPRVTLSIQNGTFFENATLRKAIDHALKNDSNIHVMGLLSDGAVHSHVNHLYAILEFLKMNRFPANRVFVDVFTDGRDVDTQSGKDFVTELENTIRNENYPGSISSIMGRYFAMDRNQSWDRTQKAYVCLIGATTVVNDNARDVLIDSYKKEVTDEFIEPTLIKDAEGKINPIRSSDTVIFYNIREDRARQITKAFILDDFKDFPRGDKIQNLEFVTMVEYEKDLPVDVIFPPEIVEKPLGKVISDASLKQLRVAETEKYAHVTYFFNGGKEKPFPGEERVLIPSPAVDYYDKTPKMSALEITRCVVDAIVGDKYDFILLNFANPDMIGHTGNIDAAIQAIEYVDECIGVIRDAALEKDHVLLVTADHGNVEEMINLRTGEKDTEHSINPVPFILVDKDREYKESHAVLNQTVGGMLSDIAPTVLEIMDIQKPFDMSGSSLVSSL
jgi:2,3-bisphosphoglycerate-independent phosphoglycerate mutase